MKEADRLTFENESLRSRLSRLSKASLRITEDLDLDTALQEIADETRSLTGASYAVVASLGQSGEAESLLASGLNADEARSLWEIPAPCRTRCGCRTSPNTQGPRASPSSSRPCR